MKRNNQFLGQREVLAIKGTYPAGTKLVLDALLDEGRYAGPKVGDWGVVVGVDDAGQIHTNWYDSEGNHISSLAVIPGVDEFHILNEINELAGDFILMQANAYGAFRIGHEEEQNPVIHFAIRKDTVLDFLRECDWSDRVKNWVLNCTTEDGDELREYAELDSSADAIPFVWMPSDEHPLTIRCIESQSAANALMDFISGLLQENGFEDASQYLDCLLEI